MPCFFSEKLNSFICDDDFIDPTTIDPAEQDRIVALLEELALESQGDIPLLSPS